MHKVSILIVDPGLKDVSLLISELMADWNSLKLVSSGVQALETVAEEHFDIIISEFDLPDMSGAELCHILKTNREISTVPFIILSDLVNESEQKNCLQQGVDYCFDKSGNSSDLVQLIKVLSGYQPPPDEFQKPGAFSGDLEQMNFIELIQSIDMNRKTGKLLLETSRQWGEIYFTEGKIVDAKTSNLQGNKAVFRMIGWNKGAFKFFNMTTDNRNEITLGAQSLILEGLRRLDEKNLLLSDLPDLNIVATLSDSLQMLLNDETLTEHEKKILLAFRANKHMQKILERNDIGDLETLRALKTLIEKGYIRTTGQSVKSGTKITIAKKKVQDTDTIKTSDGFFGNVDGIVPDEDKPSEDESH